jgi:hypothetical protein
MATEEKTHVFKVDGDLAKIVEVIKSISHGHEKDFMLSMIMQVGPKAIDDIEEAAKKIDFIAHMLKEVKGHGLNVEAAEKASEWLYAAASKLIECTEVVE